MRIVVLAGLILAIGGLARLVVDMGDVLAGVLVEAFLQGDSFATCLSLTPARLRYIAKERFIGREAGEVSRHWPTVRLVGMERTWAIRAIDARIIGSVVVRAVGCPALAFACLGIQEGDGTGARFDINATASQNTSRQYMRGDV